MVAFTPHTYVTFGGRLNERGTADEIWQCGIRGINPVSGGPIDEGQLDAYADAIVGGVKAWFGHVESLHAPQSFLDWIKVANIAASGHYSGSPVIRDSLNTAGGGDTPKLPSFCSLAISWGTGATFGKAQRGRIYPPNFSATVYAGTSHTDATATGHIQTRAHDLLDTLAQTAAEFEFRPHVMSSTGPHRLITTISVGDVVDVQRRRKNAAREAYTVGPWPAG